MFISKLKIVFDNNNFTVLYSLKDYIFAKKYNNVNILCLKLILLIYYLFLRQNRNTNEH